MTDEKEVTVQFMTIPNQEQIYKEAEHTLETFIAECKRDKKYPLLDIHDLKGFFGSSVIALNDDPTYVLTMLTKLFVYAYYKQAGVAPPTPEAEQERFKAQEEADNKEEEAFKKKEARAKAKQEEAALWRDAKHAN